MFELAEFLHYGIIALAVAVSAVGVGIGEGIASVAALKAIDIQPSAKSDITKVAVLGMALIETAAIMGVSIAIILLLNTHHITLNRSIAEIGIGLAICLPGFFIGLFSAFPTYTASLAVARQPFFAQKILRFMLIAQSLIQTPIVFGFIIAMFIKNQTAAVESLPDALKLLASGLCIGLGSIGPSIGMSLFARTACKGIGINRNAYSRLLSFTFISEAIIETPIIFALVVSILIISSSTLSSNPLLTGVALLAAALCTGLGTIGPGISSGRIAAAACTIVATKPEQEGIVAARISMFGQGLIDTCAIYALLVSIMLIIWL